MKFRILATGLLFAALLTLVVAAQGQVVGAAPTPLATKTKIVQIVPYGYVELPENFQVVDRGGDVDHWHGRIVSADGAFVVDFWAGNVESIFDKNKDNIVSKTEERVLDLPLTLAVVRKNDEEHLLAKVFWTQFSAKVRNEYERSAFLKIARSYRRTVSGIPAASPIPTAPVEWQTVAERTDYAKTSTYDETVAYCKKLAAASNGLITYTNYGKSGEGRDLPLLIAASGGASSPAMARRAGKAVILIQAGIHAGEIDGKDAGLALMRDIAITKTRIELLRNVVILFEVIYNVDGHENRSPFMRINQNGPDEMGFRANASNLNLNRDYMKADAPETRAWLSLWNEWRPDLFIDCHVTDGADFQYNVTYEYAHFQEVSPQIKAWMDEHFDGIVVPKVEKEGNLLTHYVEFAGREITGGIATFVATPRYATGYAPLRNRAGLLIETHVYKSYKVRVRGTYDVLRYTIEEVGRAKDSLFAANVISDTLTVERGKTYDPKRQFPLTVGTTDKATPIGFKGFAYTVEDSAISGGKKIVYTGEPKTYTIPKFDEGKILTSAAPPLGYIIPPQYADALGVLWLHGVKFVRLTKPREFEVESYKLTEPKWSATPFEGRITVTCKPVPITEKRTYPAGSAIISLDQEAANVAIHLLEPAAPDSLVYWGFFNSVFEQKEYGESYVLEKLAAKMLAEDPKLQEEFDRRLLDPAFARSPRARLEFFYQHTRYFLDQKVGIYPVGRITKK